MEIKEQDLIQFWKDANSYQSTSTSFDINEFLHKWVRDRLGIKALERNKEETEKYYYKVDEGFCLESCNVIGEYRKIGSIACVDKCLHNKGFSVKNNWIICSKINEATKTK